MVRLKHRYLVVKILYPRAETRSLPGEKLTIYRASPASLSATSLYRSLKDEVQEMYGDYGVGLVQSSLKIVYLSAATSTAIVRVARAHYSLVWAALAWMTFCPSDVRSAPPTPCVFHVVRVCGTIRKAEEDIIRRAKVDIARAENSPILA